MQTPSFLVFRVAGHAKKYGSSWGNADEARRVAEVLLELRGIYGTTKSCGIVTPFREQKKLIEQELSSIGLADDVIVDTASGFQGDERDLMIFSPVVAKGIRPGTASWVENPPNLINVALTRARDVLAIVGDLEYCSKQTGILGKLAQYCRDIELLSSTSPAELELFTWMVMEGWAPLVHQRVLDHKVDSVLKSSDRNFAIEVDGAAFHTNIEQDRSIDAMLRNAGYQVIRVPAKDVFETPFVVIDRIKSFMS